eukprot:1511841-Rhodomonas_salina.2
MLGQCRTPRSRRYRTSQPPAIRELSTGHRIAAAQYRTSHSTIRERSTGHRIESEVANPCHTTAQYRTSHSSIRLLSTGHRIAQYRTSHSTRVG